MLMVETDKDMLLDEVPFRSSDLIDYLDKKFPVANMPPPVRGLDIATHYAELQRLAGVRDLIDALIDLRDDAEEEAEISNDDP